MGFRSVVVISLLGRTSRLRLPFSFPIAIFAVFGDCTTISLTSLLEKFVS